MATTVPALLKTPWDCRWSRIGYRLSGVDDESQPESPFVCVRPTAAGSRRSVSDAECAECPHWEYDGRFDS